MSGSKESASTAPKTNEGFVIPPAENPVKYGATAIQDLTKALVATDLDGVFPKNYVYMVGDYNLIFHSIRGYGEQGGGFTASDDMIVLTPQGEYKTGNVKHDVQNWTNSWKFRNADLRPASDLEIVKYSPVLLGKLIHQLADELPEQTTLEDVTSVVTALDKRKTILEKAKIISQTSLGEMGVNPEEQPPDEEETTWEKRKTEREDKLLSKANAALALYKDRDQIVQDVQEVALGGRAGKVEEALLAVLQRGVTERLLKPKEFADWENLSIQSHHDDRVWNMVIAGGKIQETYAYYGKPEPARVCPEHTLEMAPVIAQTIISRAVNNVFPKVNTNF